MDRAPLVAIIGQASTTRLHKESHQNMDAIDMFRAVTKWSQSIGNAATTPEVVRKAFKIAALEKPGACVVELPEDIAKLDCGNQPINPDKTRRPGADHKAVARAAEIIAEAKYPLILAGNGTVRKQATQQLRRLAHKTGLGVVNTFMSKGVVALDDPHCLFTIGLQSRDHVNCAIDRADTIVSVGYDLVEYAPSFWNHGSEKRIVHIDFEPAEIDVDYPVTVEITADVADALWQLNEALNERFGDRLPLFDVDVNAELRLSIWEDLHAEEGDDAYPMKPQRILLDLRRALGRSDILLSDVGAHKMWVARYYQCYEPNTCLISNGFCSMGFALPGAIGAKLTFPERRVSAVCGDGGFLMNVQDLETAARLGLNIVVLIWEDGEYGLIKWKQQNHFSGRHSDLAFNNPNIEHLAKAFGIWGRRVERCGELAPLLDEAFAQDGPALLSIPVDYGENQKLTKRLGEIACTI
jgi:acetolactate synthase-1/2/3 large subunit